MNETNYKSCGYCYHPLLTWGHTNLHHQICPTLKTGLLEFWKERVRAKVKVKPAESLPTPKPPKVQATKPVTNMSLVPYLDIVTLNVRGMCIGDNKKSQAKKRTLVNCFD